MNTDAGTNTSFSLLIAGHDGDHNKEDGLDPFSSSTSQN